MPDRSILTVYNNHFKSMIGGRSQTRRKRQMQVREVKRIIRRRFGTNARSSQFVVVGDFNDYLGQGSAISSLANWREVENVVARLPEAERWTHYWARGNEYRQLDYILVSRSFSRQHSRPPTIWRYGLPWRATRYSGERYVGVGARQPKASDHCPVTFDLDL